MNELQERTERLLAEPWLARELTAIEERARAMLARHRRIAAVGIVALVVVLGAGAAVVGRPSSGDRSTTLDAAGLPERAYELGDSQLMVFLDAQASPADQERIRQELVDDPAVGQAWWRSQQDAYDEFRCLFRDDPTMIESVTPAILPSSFDVALVDGSDQDAFVVRMRSSASVIEVVTERNSAHLETMGTSVPWRPDLDPFCGTTPRGGEPIK